MAKYQLLDWVLSKGLPDALTASQHFQQSTFSQTVMMEVNFVIDGRAVCQVLLQTGTSDDLLYILDNKTYPLITLLANNPYRYRGGSSIVNLGKKCGMRNTYSLNSVLNAACNTATTAIARSIDHVNRTYGYKPECLGIVFMDTNKSII